MNDFLNETCQVIEQVSQDEIDAVLVALAELRDVDGRLFLCGNGGGAGHASHACADFRKIAGIESYCITDNVSELTARINDDSWQTCYDEWLTASRFDEFDRVFVFSVGGGTQFVSTNLPYKGALGIVGGNGGLVAKHGTAIVIPSESTPIVEGIQAVLWHYLVTALAC